MVFDPTIAVYAVAVAAVAALVLVVIGFARFGGAGARLFGGYALVLAVGVLLLPLPVLPLVVPLLVLYLVVGTRSRLRHGVQAIWNEVPVRPEPPAEVAEVIASFEEVGASVVTVLSNGEEPQPTWAAHAMTPGTEVVLVVAWRTGVHTPPPVTVTSPFAGGGSVSTMLRSSLPSGPGQVVQAFPGATVERLVIEHAAAVRWLREEGFALRRVDPADLLALHAASVEVLAERVRAHSWSTAFELWWRTALRRSRDVGSVVGRPGVVEQLRAAQASST